MSNAMVTTVRGLMTDTFRRNIRITLITVRDLTDAAGLAWDLVVPALVQLQRDGALVLYREDGPARNGMLSLEVGGQPRHLVYLLP